MKKVTLKQLAKELNLSTSTVSRALSDDYQISAKTKEMIREYAKQRNYKVNLYAKSLREGKTRTIGVVVCSLGKAFMNQIINAMYDYWHEKGYQLLVLQSKGNYQTEQNCIKRLMDVGIDGLLISPSFDGANVTYLNQLIAEELPIVIFDRVDRQLKTTQIASDNFLGGQMAAAYILTKQLENVLIIGGRNAWLSEQRIKGFVDKMDEASSTVYQSLYLELNSSPLLLEQMMQIFGNEICLSNFGAIFTTTDTLTLTVLRALKQLGLSLPVIGFCNTELADILYRQPVSIVQPSLELGKLASEKLFAAINRSVLPKGELIYLPTELIEN